VLATVGVPGVAVEEILPVTRLETLVEIVKEDDVAGTLVEIVKEGDVAGVLVEIVKEGDVAGVLCSVLVGKSVVVATTED
jgi:hypothetical protein